MKLIFCVQINISLSYKFISTLWANQVSYKVILSLLMGMIIVLKILKVISLQYMKKEVRDGVYFLHVDGHLEVERHVQSNQNRKFVTILQCIKKKVSQLLLCSIVMKNIQIFYGIQSCSLLLVYPETVAEEILAK